MMNTYLLKRLEVINDGGLRGAIDIGPSLNGNCLIYFPMRELMQYVITFEQKGIFIAITYGTRDCYDFFTNKPKHDFESKEFPLEEGIDFLISWMRNLIEKDRRILHPRYKNMRLPEVYSKMLAKN